ncbi:vesicle transport through interaction with t-SNAREs homolog 1B-like [Limulus polyphemus]|uniref:Vesicle transport through interaction with t-SNAREs homolog 1B-like n=1 Tax=Limulus polyphemus TaxID=6850 RepID=A0ABM1BAH9_LIMPO|nr:vesicle transport through interaction with t-SNAREs homolog 1B-like [Limulus polyphemus]
MSSQKFENLEDDFKSLISEVNRKVDRSLNRVLGEQKKSLLREIQRDLDELRTLLDELESEAKTAPNPYRIQMMACVRQYKQDLEQINKKCIGVGGGAAIRQELFGTHNVGSNSASQGIGFEPSGTRTKLLQMNETIGRTTESLSRTHQVAAETDQVAVEVVEELGTQRETLLRTKERLVDTDENLTRSRKIIRSMYRRVITNKVLLIVIIFMELGIIGIEAYFKWGRKHGKN